jgi:hypothetical protein
VVVAKLARVHSEEPTLGVSDLNDVKSRALVMVGDDHEVTPGHNDVMRVVTEVRHDQAEQHSGAILHQQRRAGYHSSNGGIDYARRLP